MIKARLKTDYLIMAGIFLGFLSNLIEHENSITANLSTYIWTAVVLFWMYSFHMDITDTKTRRILHAGGWLLILLFILRFARYNFAAPGTAMSRLFWYSYYIPICIIPLLSLVLSLHLKGNGGVKIRTIAPLSAICALLALLMLTNDLHGMALRVYYREGTEYSAAKPFYFFVLLWSFCMMFLSFLIMFFACRLSKARNHWYIPASTCFVGIALLTAYYLCGGSSPELFGQQLYKLQEVIVILFLGFWESCILIGLIPSSSMLNERDWIKEGIYEKISGQDEAMRRNFNSMWGKDEKEFKENLLSMATLGAYIKRRANLELISDEQGCLSTKELFLSISESFEYFSLADVSVYLEETGEAMIPSLLIVEPYEIFEEIMEKKRNASYVKLQAAEDGKTVSFSMIMEADMPDQDDAAKDFFAALKQKHGAFLRHLGADMSLSEKDETLFLSISGKYPSGRKGLSSFNLIRGRKAGISSGLYGLSRYFYLEREALAKKIRIHDHMGRSLLMTKRYLLSPMAVGRDALMQEWSRCLLQMEEAPSDLSRTFNLHEAKDVCLRQAKKLGIELEFSGPLPEDVLLRSIVDSALTVQITNTLRHTAGKKVFATASEKDGNYILRLSNDGEPDIEEIHETGGLKNLRAQAEGAGGSMEVKISTESPMEKRFILTLILPEDLRDMKKAVPDTKGAER